ncbi:MAG: hypothetical protein J6L58_01645, partial [Clostridia bacterium]|nr:hypothetical protein [Clostridia bacterium]
TVLYISGCITDIINFFGENAQVFVLYRVKEVAEKKTPAKKSTAKKSTAKKTTKKAETEEKAEETAE